jgi:hypothetical protein
MTADERKVFLAVGKAHVRNGCRFSHTAVPHARAGPDSDRRGPPPARRARVGGCQPGQGRDWSCLLSR